MNTTDLKIIQDFFAANPGCSHIVCEFNGEGDSGAIDDVRGANDVTGKLPTALSKAAEDLAYEALEKQGIDWYNNDGGFGEVLIFPSGHVRCDTHTRRIQTDLTETEYSFEQLNEAQKE